MGEFGWPPGVNLFSTVRSHYARQAFRHLLSSVKAAHKRSVAVVHGGLFGQLLAQRHAQALAEWVRPMQRFKRAASSR